MKWNNLFIVLFICLPNIGQAGHTGAGSGGGDPIRALVEVTRTALQRTLDYFGTKISSAQQEKVCDHSNLTREQRATCVRFIRDVRVEMETLLSDSNRLPFQIVDELSPIVGPDGPTAAWTALGSGTHPINFNRLQTGSLAPRALFMLIAHEVGHRVAWKTIDDQPIEDDKPILNFESGRKLLDSFGINLAILAERAGIIGPTFQFFDQFACSFRGETVPTAPTSFRKVTTHSSQPFGSYETGIGPKYNSRVVTKVGEVCVAVELQVSEKTNCDEQNTAGREIKGRLISYKPSQYSKAEVISTWSGSGNPVCEGRTVSLPVKFEENLGLNVQCYFVNSMVGYLTTFAKKSDPLLALECLVD